MLTRPHYYGWKYHCCRNCLVQCGASGWCRPQGVTVRALACGSSRLWEPEGVGDPTCGSPRVWEAHGVEALACESPRVWKAQGVEAPACGSPIVGVPGCGSPSMWKQEGVEGPGCRSQGCRKLAPPVPDKSHLVGQNEILKKKILNI